MRIRKIFFLILFVFFLPLFGTDHDDRVVEYNGIPTPSTVVEVYAHRAGRGIAPENTLWACESALRLGVDYVDFDIAMTKDGILVVSHGVHLTPDITRGSRGKFISAPIPIYELTYEQLQAYNVGQIDPSSEYATFFPMQNQLESAQIPTLKQAIEYIKSISGKKVGFQIEIKTDPIHPELTPSPGRFARALYYLLKETDSIDQTEVQSFDFRCLFVLQKLDPLVKTTYLTGARDSTNVAAWIDGYDNSIPKMIKALGGNTWGPFEMEVTAAEMDEAHHLGLKVVPWGLPEIEGTEFNYSQIVKLIEWGADGIITDRPGELREVLSARGYNLPQGFLVIPH